MTYLPHLDFFWPPALPYPSAHHVTHTHRHTHKKISTSTRTHLVCERAQHGLTHVFDARLARSEAEVVLVVLGQGLRGVEVALLKGAEGILEEDDNKTNQTEKTRRIII